MAQLNSAASVDHSNLNSDGCICRGGVRIIKLIVVINCWCMVCDAVGGARDVSWWMTTVGVVVADGLLLDENEMGVCVGMSDCRMTAG